MTADLLRVVVFGAVFDIGENLTSVLLQLISLAGILLGAGAAVSAKRTADQVRRQTEPNGGTSMRDSINRIETATVSLHEKLTDERPPLPPPPPPTAGG